MRRWIGMRCLGGCVAAVLFVAAFAMANAATSRPNGGEIALRDGRPTLLVDGRPFFFYGAAFFYERIPARQWRTSMLALRALGFNTLDVYVPWNWHEVRAGEFDFDGHTNAQRNLRGVLGLARELGFKLIVRPGPVIRNEWRNGGYPAWLLIRPSYGMPLHDVLEGRYPATATLQNANSDDAAAQWMHNATHMRFARRWLRTALAQCTPFARSIVAVQLDDDQGAYIDNQTWPAPHLHAYLRRLESIVRGVVGSQIPVFINTYEMKVTASAPVWAMGNWYQSDAYSIGEHDRTSLEFSTGLLQTQTAAPVAMSEFQAGWLAPPEDPAPRPADPTNTTLALHTLLGMGARGVIDFPAQDTVNPAGWEAPFANVAYAWDAALDTRLRPSARYEPTRRFGELVRAAGPQLAAAHRLADGAIAYLSSAYDPASLTNADVFKIAAATQAAQQACRTRRLTCDLVDLRYVRGEQLARYPFLVIPPEAVWRPFAKDVLAKMHRYRGRVVTHAPVVERPRAGGIRDATVLLSADGVTAFLDVVNYERVARKVRRTRIVFAGGRTWDIKPFSVPARDAVLLRSDGVVLGGRVPAGAEPTTTPRVTRCAPADSVAPTAVRDDRADDGMGRVTLANGLISVTITPAAGGRAFEFSDGCAAHNAFTSVGSLRDDVEIQPPLSTTDRIGKYTRSFAAGMFNRNYRIVRTTATPDEASVTLRYDAPDVVPAGASFERTIALRRNERAFSVTAHVTFAGGIRSRTQRPVRYDSFDARGATLIDDRAAGAIGFYYTDRHALAVLSWPQADVENSAVIAERTSTVVRLRFMAGGRRRTSYSIDPAADIRAARAIVKERGTVAENEHIAAGAWRNGRRSCLKSNRV